MATRINPAGWTPGAQRSTCADRWPGRDAEERQPAVGKAPGGARASGLLPEYRAGGKAGNRSFHGGGVGSSNADPEAGAHKWEWRTRPGRRPKPAREAPRRVGSAPAQTPRGDPRGGQAERRESAERRAASAGPRREPKGLGEKEKGNKTPPER